MGPVVLVALDSQDIRILATDANRNLDYRCPICHKDVVLKRGPVKISHYAHYPSSTCENAGESYRHMEMKWQVGQRATKEGYSVDYERLFGEHRCDIILTFENTNLPQTIIEVQNSPISYLEIRARSAWYNAFKIETAWIFDSKRIKNIGFVGFTHQYYVPKEIRTVALVFDNRVNLITPEGELHSARLYNVWKRSSRKRIGFTPVHRINNLDKFYNGRLF